MTSVKLIAHKGEQAHRVMERGLQALDIDYQLIFAEDEPERAAHYLASDSPCLVIDDRVAYHGCLSPSDLEAIFAGERARTC